MSDIANDHTGARRTLGFIAGAGLLPALLIQLGVAAAAGGYGSYRPLSPPAYGGYGPGQPSSARQADSFGYLPARGDFPARAEPWMGQTGQSGSYSAGNIDARRAQQSPSSAPLRIYRFRDTPGLPKADEQAPKFRPGKFQSNTGGYTPYNWSSNPGSFQAVPIFRPLDDAPAKDSGNGPDIWSQHPIPIPPAPYGQPYYPGADTGYQPAWGGFRPLPVW